MERIVKMTRYQVEIRFYRHIIQEGIISWAEHHSIYIPYGKLHYFKNPEDILPKIKSLIKPFHRSFTRIESYIWKGGLGRVAVLMQQNLPFPYGLNQIFWKEVRDKVEDKLYERA